MLGKSVLLFSADKGESKRLGACLRAAGNDVLTLADPGPAANLIEARAVDLVVVDHDGAPGAQQLIDASGGRVPVVVMTARPDPHLVLELLCDRRVDNLLARRGQGAIDMREMMVTSEKILSRQLFGIDKYLPGFGVHIQRCEVRGAEWRDGVVESVQEYLRVLGAGRDLLTAMGTVADELLTNAIYNAPRDVHGRARYAATDRREKVVLSPVEYAHCAFGSDGRTFALAVEDHFGALTGEHLRSALRRCLTAADPIEQKAGGAGLGLYTVLSSCTQLVINVAPGARTEIIALVDLEKRMKGIRSEGHSLHLFLAPREAATQVSDVALSDSMRLDLRCMAGNDTQVQQPIPLVKRKAANA